MREDLREQLEQIFVAIAKRHRAYVLVDPRLGLASRQARRETIRDFYGTFFHTLGMVKAATAWYRLNIAEPSTTTPVGKEEKTYTLPDVLHVVGAQDNVVVFKVLERFAEGIVRQDLEGKIEFIVGAETVQDIVKHLQETHSLNYNRLKKVESHE